MQICSQQTVRVHGSVWIDEDDSSESHWRFIVSVAGTGRRYPNLLVSKYSDGAIHVVDLNAPLRKIPMEIALLLAREVANHRE